MSSDDLNKIRNVDQHIKNLYAMIDALRKKENNVSINSDSFYVEVDITENHTFYNGHPVKIVEENIAYDFENEDFDDYVTGVVVIGNVGNDTVGVFVKTSGKVLLRAGEEIKTGQTLAVSEDDYYSVIPSKNSDAKWRALSDADEGEFFDAEFLSGAGTILNSEFAIEDTSETIDEVKILKVTISGGHVVIGSTVLIVAETEFTITETIHIFVKITYVGGAYIATFDATTMSVAFPAPIAGEWKRVVAIPEVEGTKITDTGRQQVGPIYYEG